MSRGGRGGRGRGRGDFARDLIRDNLDDLGVDFHQVLDTTTPQPLFPVIDIPLPYELSVNDRYRIEKAKSITRRCEAASVTFLRSYYLLRKVSTIALVFRTIFISG